MPAIHIPTSTDSLLRLLRRRTVVFLVLPEPPPEVSRHLLQALREGHDRLPPEQLLRPGDVRLPSPRVVRGVLLVDGGGVGVDNLANLIGELLHRELPRVADVDRSGVFSVHESDEPVDEVADVLERSGLRAVAVDGHRGSLDGLLDEVGDDAAVVEGHAGTVGVENARDSNLEAVLAEVIESQGLGASLAFVVAWALADGVDVAPVVLRLRVLQRVAVDLGGGGEEEAGAGALMLGVKFFGGKEEQRAKREK